jgi:hypothetical protein
MKPYQQGDVILKPIASLPSKLRKIKHGSRGCVLAEGEATGHAHAIKESASVIAYGENGDGRVAYVQVDSPSVLSHEEHGPIVVPAGLYRVEIVREQDPFADEIRQVRD